MTQNIKKVLLISFGFLNLGLGTLGIFLPLLPTTVFYLIALWCFSKSSERFHQMMLTNRVFGKFLADYRAGLGVPLRVKIGTVALLWASIGYAGIFVVHLWWVRLILLAIAVGVTIHMVMLKTRREGLAEKVAEGITQPETRKVHP